MRAPYSGQPLYVSMKHPAPAATTDPYGHGIAAHRTGEPGPNSIHKAPEAWLFHVKQCVCDPAGPG